MSKQKMPEQKLSYHGILNPNDRKKKCLEKTLKFLRSGTEVFLDLIINLYGGITPQIIIEKYNQNIDIDLICAVFWFKALPIKHAKDGIETPTAIKRLNDYLGKEPSQTALQYLSFSINDEKYKWVDCRQRYQSFCNALNIKDLNCDLQTFVRNEILSIPGKKPKLSSYAIVSKLFGKGKKEDSDFKKRIIESILNKIETERPINYGMLQSYMLQSVKAENNTQFKKIYKGKGSGRDANFLKCLYKPQMETCTIEDIEKIKIELQEIINNKSEPVNWQHNEKIETFLTQKIGAFKQESWSEMWKNAFADIQGKNTLNFNMSLDRVEFKKELQNLNLDGVNLLNDFFESPYFTSDNKFIIEPHHVHKNLKNLYKTWSNLENVSEENIDETINDYIDEIKDTLDKIPHKQILRYLYSIKDQTTAKQIIEAAKYNHVNKKINEQKIHPVVAGKIDFTWGNSALRGNVIPPSKARKSHPNDPRIWIEIELLDENNKWVKHHIPFTNAKLMEDFYNFKKQNEYVKLPRNKRFGYEKPILESTDVEILQSINPKWRKSQKRIIRSNKIIKNVSNINWEEKTPICINVNDDGKFRVKVVVKFNTNYSDKRPLINGDKILSIDQNQTALHSFAVLKLHKNGIAYKVKDTTYHVIPEQTGSITSYVSVNGKQCDQLSYNGLPFNEYKSWIEQRNQFIIKSKSIDCKEQFTTLKKKKLNLYPFNREYAKILIKFSKEKTLTPEIIRPEIFEFISNKGASILNVSSLSETSFETLKLCKNLINVYFANLINKKEITDQDKQDYDLEMFNLQQRLNEKRRNKGKEKINRCANSIIKMALEAECKFIALEDGLSSNGSKNTNKKQNRRNTEWLAQGLVKKIKIIAPMHELVVLSVIPHFTSHQQPLVHKNPNDEMKARFNEMKVEEILEWTMRKLKNYLKKEHSKGTAQYYYQATIDFLKNYELIEYKDQIKSGKIKFHELSKILKDKNIKSVLIPMKGGRKYLATYKVTTDACEVEYLREKWWLSNADEIAAVNIGLAALKSRGSLPSKTPEPLERN